MRLEVKDQIVSSNRATELGRMRDRSLHERPRTIDDVVSSRGSGAQMKIQLGDHGTDVSAVSVGRTDETMFSTNRTSPRD